MLSCISLLGWPLTDELDNEALLLVPRYAEELVISSTYHRFRLITELVLRGPKKGTETTQHQSLVYLNVEHTSDARPIAKKTQVEETPIRLQGVSLKQCRQVCIYM